MIIHDIAHIYAQDTELIRELVEALEDSMEDLAVRVGIIHDMYSGKGAHGAKLDNCKAAVCNPDSLGGIALIAKARERLE